MDPFLTQPQIEEYSYFDPYEEIVNNPYIEDDYYDDQTFSDYLSSGNDF